MTRHVLPAALKFCALAAAGYAEAPVETEALSVPSGQPVVFLETVTDHPAMGLTARFRFVAPQLPTYVADLPYEALEADMAALCDSYALPRLSTPQPSTIVISLASEPVPFADPDPDVTQVFEAYSPVEDHCEWEAF